MSTAAAADILEIRQAAREVLGEIRYDLAGQILARTSGAIRIGTHPTRLTALERVLVDAAGGHWTALHLRLEGQAIFTTDSHATAVEDLTCHGDSDDLNETLEDLAELLADWREVNATLRSDVTKTCKHGFVFEDRRLRAQVVDLLGLESAEHDEAWMLDAGPAVEVAATAPVAEAA